MSRQKQFKEELELDQLLANSESRDLAFDRSQPVLHDLRPCLGLRHGPAP